MARRRGSACASLITSMPLDLPTLFSNYNVPPRGAIHAGAHDGQEVELYAGMGFKSGLFFEPQPFMFGPLTTRMRPYPGFRAVGAALGSRVGVATMYTETVNYGLSASLLKPKVHLTQYPEIPFTGTIEVPLTTLDEHFKGDDVSSFNFLNMDVQGYELEVLKGGMGILSRMDAIFSEVNRAEMYEGCAMVEQIDAFLATFGFRRRETDWKGDTWGEAFYVKETRLSS